MPHFIALDLVYSPHSMWVLVIQLKQDTPKKWYKSAPNSFCFCISNYIIEVCLEVFNEKGTHFLNFLTSHFNNQNTLGLSKKENKTNIEKLKPGDTYLFLQFLLH